MTYYNNSFSVGANNAEMIKLISDTVSQFFDDERIHFECYYEVTDYGIIFFGLYTCCNEALYERDSRVLGAMVEYLHNFNKPYDGGDIIFDARIEEGFFGTFEAKYLAEDGTEPEPAPEVKEKLLAAMERLADDAFVFDSEEDEDAAKADDSDLTAVLFDPKLIAKLDADEIEQVNETAFGAAEEGDRVLVLDEETAESGELFEMIMKSHLKEAMVRK